MQSNYKRLGDYIKEVSIKNTDLKVNNLIGVSIDKKFIKSVANTIGVDMSTYKIIKKNQLACKLMSVGRDEKLPVDLYVEEEPSLVSSAYYVFEPIDSNILMPEYLKMWLFRSETDRYVGYVSGGDVRGGISWDTFCDIPIKVPAIEKQQEIVNEYHTIQNRINLNNQLIAKLEETAQTIYKQWFVDFEFPFDFAQGKPSENGKPYKSNGGKMVWCEELEKEIPEGWYGVQLKNLVTCNPDTLSSKDDFKKILYLDTSNITNNKIDVLQELNLEFDEIPSRARRKVKTNDIIYSTVRPILKHYGIIKNLPDNLIVSTGFAVFRVKYKELFPELIYSFLTDDKTINYLQAKAEMSVSTYPSITSDDILNLYFAKPDNKTLENALEIFKSKDDFINLKNKENQKLEELKDLLLAKMTRVEN